MHARQISYFLAVVEHGGFGRAAAALQIAQPSLSQSVKALERFLGAELFRRAPHGVVLTAAGLALLGPARQLMRDVTAARNSVGTSVGPTVVDLVGAPTLGTYPGADLVASFVAANPNVQVRLDRADTEDDLAALVWDGSYELGLAYLPVPRLELVGVELGRHHLMLAFPPDAQPPPGPVTVSAVAGLTLVGPPRGSRPRAVVESALRQARVRTRVAVELNHRDATFDLVQAGVGAAFLIDATAPAAAARGLIMRELEPPLRLSFGLVHHRRPLSEAARAFMAHAQARLAGAPEPAAGVPEPGAAGVPQPGAAGVPQPGAA